MLTDVQYAISQLRGINLRTMERTVDALWADRVQRALDALERVEAELDPEAGAITDEEMDAASAKVERDWPELFAQ